MSTSAHTYTRMQNCKYHPLDPAVNYCHYCDCHYCEACSDEGGGRNNSRSAANESSQTCFVCDSALESTSSDEQIVPFWSRIAEVYKYPLSPESIGALLIVSLITAVLGNASLLLILPTVAIMLYSFACLRQTAKGRLKAPSFEACFEDSIAPLFYVLIAFFVLVFLVYFVFELLGTGFGILATAFFIISIPAVIILIAVEESLLASLNPARLFEVMRATGISYFVMILFLLIMMSSVGVIIAVFGGEADSFLGIFFQSLISNYYGLVSYHIMGYLVYQNQAALGYEHNAGVTNNQQANRSDVERLKAKLELLVKAGNYTQAQEIAVRLLREPSATLWDWSRAFSLACASNPTKSAQQKAVKLFYDYARELETKNDYDTLADAYLKLRRRYPDFVIDNHEQRLFIANSLFDTGHYSYVVNMLHRFHEQTDDTRLAMQALKLLSESLSSIPGKEKMANRYQTLYQLQQAKIEHNQAVLKSADLSS